MRKDTENPEGNDLPPGCKEEALLSAIEESGYPFQGQVAYKLKEHFHVTEEWGYVDSSTKEHRSLDIFGYRLLNENKKAAVQPRCAVLVECKQSRHPYVFFRRVTDRLIPDFPAIASVPHDIMISQMVGDSSERSTMIHASHVLGLDQVPFVHTGPPICASFSRAVPNGKKFNLSGVDPFKTIILPLARALDHTLDIWKGHQRQSPQYPTLLLLISVIDAPIILVEAPDRTSDPVLTPWLRVVRQEAVTTETKSGKQYRFYAVDIVHAGYLNRFVTQHLLPLCDTFAERALKRGDILLRGGEVRTWTSGDGIRSVQGVVDNAGAGATQGSMLSAATPRSAVTRPKSMPPSPLSVLRGGALRASRRASRSIAHPEARPRTDLICRTTHATSNCCGCCGLLRIDAPAWRKW